MAIRAFTVIVFGLLYSLVTAAGETPRISELSYVDHQYMADQRSTLDDLARTHLGSQFNGNKDSDLRLLQTLLDRNLVRGSQTRELQAMGVIMGEHLSRELNMQWVIYEDRVGRSRALRYRDSDNYLFPMTMISRRREVDNLSPVTDIYQRAVDLITPSLPSLPFK